MSKPTNTPQIDNLSPTCRSCANLATPACSAFQRMVEAGVDAEVLKGQIKALQEGEELNACSNSPDAE